MARMERKYLAHYLDANFNEGAANYVRLGKDLETYSEELNPQVEVRRNILGEQNVIHQGYQVQSTAEPFYADEDDELFEPIAKVANERRTGEDCQTTRVEVLLDASGNQIWCYREDCWVVPNAVGGDTSGVQLPFNVYNAGNRVAGVWSVDNKTFTEATITLNKTSESIVGTGTKALTATTSPTVSGATVKWTSSDTSVATVNNGTVTGAGTGTCVITADWFGAKATCTITVTAS